MKDHIRRNGRDPESQFYGLSMTPIYIWAFLVGFFDIMSIWSILSCYFSNPGYVKDYFRSRIIHENGDIHQEIESRNLVAPSMQDEESTPVNTQTQSQYTVKKYAIYEAHKFK